MQQNRNTLIGHWVTRGILIIWALFVVLDYAFHHLYYEQAVLEFSYWGLLGLLGLVLSVSWFFVFRIPPTGNQRFSIRINGIGLYGLVLVMMVLVYGYYCSVNGFFSKTVGSQLAYFVGHNVKLHFFVFVLLLSAFSLGAFLLYKLRSFYNSASFNLISLAVGLSILGIAGVIIGQMKMFYPGVLWPLIAIGFVLNYKMIFPFLKRLFWERHVFKLEWEGLLAGAILCIFLSVNAIAAIKIFPSGFDGANLYMNISKLIGEYHGLPEGGQAFNWSVIMGFGKVLFKNMAVAILLAHLAGILCLVIIFRIARLFLSTDKALLAATIFYIAPYISFHNIRDEKVDLGFLFISLSALLVLLEFLVRRQKEGNPNELQSLTLFGTVKVPVNVLIWGIAGWLTGFAFGIKYIALLNFIAIITYLFYTKAGRWAYLGFLGVALGGLFLVRLDRFAGIDLGTTSPFLMAGLFMLIGGVMLVLVFRQTPDLLKELFVPATLFAFFFVLAYTPWLFKHGSENQSWSISALTQGKSPQPVITINPEYLNRLDNPIDAQERWKDEIPSQSTFTPEPLVRFTSNANNTVHPSQKNYAILVDQEVPEERSAGEQVKREELQRYLGFESGLPLYLSLPYDLTMSTNFPGHIYLDVGFLLLLLLPLLLLVSGSRKRWKNVVLLIWMIFLIVLGLYNVYGVVGKFEVSEATKQVDQMVAQSQAVGMLLGGIYKIWLMVLFQITAACSQVYELLAGMNFMTILLALFLLFGLLIWGSHERLKLMPNSLKALLSFVGSFLFLWLILGNGVPWYGFPALTLLPIFLVYYYARPAEILGKEQKTFFRYFFGVAIGVYFVMNLMLHFHNHENGKNAHLFFKTPFIHFAGQPMKKSAVLSKFNPFFPDAVRMINSDRESKVYRVGTYLNYHIRKNDKRVYGDNQLGLFDQITSSTTHPGHFVQTLKENGFRYILYDLRTASIDKTPEKSLTRKNQAFVHQMLNGGQVELRVTDRIVEDPTGNTLKKGDLTFPGKAGLIGKAVYQGSFALFEIK